MDHLWAPWRLAYVAAAKPPTDGDPCFICRGLRESDDRANLIARRSDHCVTVLNRFPYNNGHLLIAPCAHKGVLRELSTEEVVEIQQTITRLLDALDRLLRPEGYNIGLNLGRAAGAGLPGHLHWHLVPRWNGDTNFMPVLTDVKVIAQSLDSLWELLVDELADKMK
ncbi:MAG: HIT domain-containing protein [Planctomycetes bacterium]|nr:HIT domain-containing protein [Planctomycetota bacterium]